MGLIDTEEAAKRVLAHTLPQLPYVDSTRKDFPLDRLLEQLMGYWEHYTEEAPTSS